MGGGGAQRAVLCVIFTKMGACSAWAWPKPTTVNCLLIKVLTIRPSPNLQSEETTRSDIFSSYCTVAVNKFWGTGTKFLITKFLITKFLITKFLITKFLSNKVPKALNS